LHEILRVLFEEQNYGIKTHPQPFRPNGCLSAQRRKESFKLQGVPLVTEPGISLIILTPM
jgi:hypothetical protein